MTGLDSILVPLDGSDAAAQAVPVGATLAQRAGAVLHLALVDHEPSLVAPEPAGSGTYLDGLTDQVRRHFGLTPTGAVLHGQPAAVLAEHARDRGVALVVMTTHGRSGFPRRGLGATADRLLRISPAPILLLPRAGPQPPDFHRILVGLRGEGDDPLVDAALTMGGLGPPAVYVLGRVVPRSAPIISPLPAYPSSHPPDWARRQEIAASTALARLAARLVARDREIVTAVVPGTSVPGALLELARSRAVDLIVLGSHGAGALERLMLGSVADKVLRAAEQPVLLVPLGEH